MLDAEVSTPPEALRSTVLFVVTPVVAAELLGCTRIGAQHWARTMGEGAHRRVMKAQTPWAGLCGP
ncbi:MAG: hypothetical protein CL927_06090 [Deltaproteobacteria bacterium]|nr:hypothetical protein [Deltaproteobacteria bacterium]HCH66136.1 hypothetical protein [Deltaproteobacteria bacterium]